MGEAERGNEATHQFGYAERNIPARPFLPVEGLPGDWQNDVLDAHSKITARNREAVSGKPQTQVNVQTNVAGTDANAIIEELRRKHGG